MSQQNQAHEDDCNSALDFCTFCNGNGKELMNELKWKVANLEAKNQLFEATNKYLEEKLKHFEEKQILEKKYFELEAKMRNLELMQKMEHLEADFNKKLAVLEEQQKGNSDLVTEGNAKAEAQEKAEENIQKNQQKIKDLSLEVDILKSQYQILISDNMSFGRKLKEAEQKAETANNKLETTIQEIQKKMEESAVKETVKDEAGWEPIFSGRGGRGRGGFRGGLGDPFDRLDTINQGIQKELEESASKKKDNDDGLSAGGPSGGGMRGWGFGGRGGRGGPPIY